MISPVQLYRSPIQGPEQINAYRYQKKTMKRWIAGAPND